MKKYKKHIGIGLLFFILIVIFHEFVITKIFKVLDQNEKIEGCVFERDKLEKIQKKVDNEYVEIQKKISILEEEAERKKSQKRDQKAFNSEVEFENFAKEKMDKNYLHLDSIARIERDDESENKYFPYEFSGGLYSMVNFFTELEDSNMNISLDKTPFVISNKDKASFNGKIRVKIVDEDKELKKKRENISIYKLSKKEIAKSAIINMKKNRYLLIRYIDNSNLILKENEKIEIDEREYRLKIEGKKVLFEEADGDEKC